MSTEQNPNVLLDTRGRGPARDRKTVRADRQEANSSPAEKDRLRHKRDFRARWTNSAMPDLPADMIPGYGLYYATTIGNTDTPESKLLQGYSYVRIEEVPDMYKGLFTNDSAGKHGGRYDGCACVKELILMKLPLDEREEAMHFFHHDEPFERLARVSDGAKGLANEHRGGRAITEGDLDDEVSQKHRRPIFS